MINLENYQKGDHISITVRRDQHLYEEYTSATVVAVGPGHLRFTTSLTKMKSPPRQDRETGKIRPGAEFPWGTSMDDSVYVKVNDIAALSKYGKLSRI